MSKLYDTEETGAEGNGGIVEVQTRLSLHVCSLSCMFQDLGCGWGSFGLYVCEKFPKCRVTCVSNSNTQRQLIQARAQERGFADRLEAITADANTFHTSNKYDRIVSIEMFEVRGVEVFMEIPVRTVFSPWMCLREREGCLVDCLPLFH